MNDTKFAFTRKLTKTGGSKTVSIPEEILKDYGWEEGQELKVMPDINKKGQKYVAIFVEDK